MDNNQHKEIMNWIEIHKKLSYPQKNYDEN